jgi:hypothetical protein
MRRREKVCVGCEYRGHYQRGNTTYEGGCVYVAFMVLEDRSLPDPDSVVPEQCPRYLEQVVMGQPHEDEPQSVQGLRVPGPDGQ